MNATKILVAFIFLVTLSSATALNQKQKKKILFFGDSITELGVKEGGYIRQLNAFLEKNDLGEKYELTGSGISGNKVYDLYLRLEDDVLSKKPDVVVIWIGVNDVWHKQLLHTGTDADKFDKFYRAIISKIQEQRIKIYLVTPAVVGEKKQGQNPLDDELDKYSAIIRKISKDEKTGLIDLRSAFIEYLQNHNADNAEKGILTYDGVHLNGQGNKFVAEQIFDQLKTDIFTAR